MAIRLPVPILPGDPHMQPHVVAQLQQEPLYFGMRRGLGGQCLGSAITCLSPRTGIRFTRQSVRPAGAARMLAAHRSVAPRAMRPGRKHPRPGLAATLADAARPPMTGEPSGASELGGLLGAARRLPPSIPL